MLHNNRDWARIAQRAQTSTDPEFPGIDVIGHLHAASPRGPPPPSALNYARQGLLRRRRTCCGGACSCRGAWTTGPTESCCSHATVLAPRIVRTDAENPFRIDGIQYLRAVAALMVVAHHARHYSPQGDQWSTFGSRGVDIFFVIRGFVMAHSTQGYRADANHPGDEQASSRRRPVRLGPARRRLEAELSSVPVVVTRTTGVAHRSGPSIASPMQALTASGRAPSP